MFLFKKLKNIYFKYYRYNCWQTLNDRNKKILIIFLLDLRTQPQSIILLYQYRRKTSIGSPTVGVLAGLSCTLGLDIPPRMLGDRMFDRNRCVQ